VVQWVPPADDVSTCGALIDTAGIGCSLALEGAYLDDFDRIFEFTTTTGGVVGDTVSAGPLFSWVNLNQERTGRVIGAFNLGNDGGVFQLTPEGNWRRTNDGLPIYLSRVDVLALAATASRSGRLVAYLEDRQSRGLWLRPDDGAAWRRLAPDLFPDGAPVSEALPAVAISPDDPQTIVVGTLDRGIFVSQDGGETFVQHRDDLASEGQWNQRRVALISWQEPGTLLVGINDLGLFKSGDGGETFAAVSGFTVPQLFPVGGAQVAPQILSLFTVSGDTILAGVARFALFETTDGGLTWVRIWRDQDPEHPVPVNGTAVITAADNSREIWLGTGSQGLWHSTDGGGSWVAADVSGVTDPASLSIHSLSLDEAGQRFVAVTDGAVLLTCPVGGSEWSADLPGPGISGLVAAVGGAGDSRLWLATRGGGIYIPGTPLHLSDTIVPSQTDAEYRNFDFGFDLEFGPGTITLDPTDQSRHFSLVAQDFQGYAVWRSQVGDPHHMELIGLYDKNNPETCIEGYCGDTSVFIQPGCFHEKRAACFDFSDPDTVRFFDGDIFDGFVYNYAVTTFDYGNTAMVSPQAMTAEMLFSPRYAGDPLTSFPGPGNFVEFRANVAASAAGGGEGIYVVPNPLRLTSVGLTSADRGVEVMFKNLGPGSHVQVFTVDGDLVADLGPEHMAGRNMSWVTRNRDGQLLAAGVYIYRVQQPGRDDYFDKLVIIR